MSTILITGGTGLVGTRLSELLIEKGFEVIVLTRNPNKLNKSDASIRYALWDLEKKWIDPTAIQAADHLIHLAGEGVAEKRWTTERKAAIRNSRAETGALIVKTIMETPNKIQTVISASAIGWYGPDTKESMQVGFIETAAADNSFLGETCKIWESQFANLETTKIRSVIFRIGIVLSVKGGALKEFLKPIRFGIAAILGNGKQNISWIHIDDLCAMFIKSITDASMQGVYNAVAPEVVTNKELTIALAKKNKLPFFVPVFVPAFILKTILGEMSVEVLKSTKVRADKILSTGFQFQYPDIQTSIDDLMKDL